MTIYKLIYLRVKIISIEYSKILITLIKKYFFILIINYLFLLYLPIIC